MALTPALAELGKRFAERTASMPLPGSADDLGTPGCAERAYHCSARPKAVLQRLQAMLAMSVCFRVEWVGLMLTPALAEVGKRFAERTATMPLPGSAEDSGTPWSAEQAYHCKDEYLQELQSDSYAHVGVSVGHKEVGLVLPPALAGFGKRCAERSAKSWLPGSAKEFDALIVQS